MRIHHSFAVLGAFGVCSIAAGGSIQPGTSPFMHTSRFAAQATDLSNGTILVTGGNPDSFSAQNNPDAEIYDSLARTFTAIAVPMTARKIQTGQSHRRVRHTATLLNDGTVLLVGGADFYAGSSAEIFETPGTFTASGSAKSFRVGHTATS